jgi:hypothetical protein
MLFLSFVSYFPLFSILFPGRKLPVGLKKELILKHGAQALDFKGEAVTFKVTNPILLTFNSWTMDIKMVGFPCDNFQPKFLISAVQFTVG